MNQPIDITIYDLNAENYILGVIMVSSSAKKFDVLIDIFEKLKPENFYTVVNQLIFKACHAIYANNVTLDPITIFEQLNTYNLGEMTPDIKIIFELFDIIPTVENYNHYIEIILDKSRRRELMNISFRIKEIAYDFSKPVNLSISEISSELDLLASNRFNTELFSAKDVIEIIMDDFSINIEKAEKGEKIDLGGISTGLSDVDNLIGGLNPTDFIIIAGRPSMGKTTLALNIALNVTLQDHVLVFISLEMNKEQLFHKMVSIKSKLNSYKLKTYLFNPEEKERLYKAMSDIASKSFYTYEVSGFTPTKLRAIVKFLKNKHKDKKVQVVIDYIGLMYPDRETGNPVIDISSITKSLKRIAKEEDINILGLAQLSRAVENRADKRPQLSDLRDSGSLEQDSDIVGFVYRDSYYNPLDGDSNVTEFSIKKHRHGAQGMVKLFTDLATSTFTCIEKFES